MLESLRRYLYRSKLSKKIKKHPDRRNPINHGIRIGLLCFADKADQIQAVLDYKEKLEKQNKKVKILGYSNSKEERTHLPFPYFNKKNVSWYNTADGEEVELFIKSNFDLLINLDILDIKPIHFVASACSSRLKVGKFNPDEDCYQILINLDEGKDNIDELIYQVSESLNLLSNAKPK